MREHPPGAGEVSLWGSDVKGRFAWLFIALALCLGVAEVARAAGVELWRESGGVVQSRLPEVWRPMDAGALTKIGDDRAVVSAMGNGELVAGFTLPVGDDGRLVDAQILVFRKHDESIDKDRMEKVIG